MSQYFISGVWKNKQGDITHVLLHAFNNNVLAKGKRFMEKDVITLIKSGHEVTTIKWNYTVGTWMPGEKVVVVKLLHEFLQTVPDSTIQDKLDNMIRMEAMR